MLLSQTYYTDCGIFQQSAYCDCLDRDESGNSARPTNVLIVLKSVNDL
jgi:hypothetical protein